MRKYSGKNTAKISFPLGGIGTGNIAIAGNGALIEWEIFHRPAKLCRNGFSHFAVRAERDGAVLDTRILQGPFTGDFTGAPDTFGFGVERESLAGAPCFEHCEFQGRFPFAELTFRDPSFPGIVHLTAFNPFIPLNEFDSSLPGALFQIEIENTTDARIRYTVVAVVANPWREFSDNKFISDEGWNGLRLRDCSDGKDALPTGEIILATDHPEISWQENLYKGAWFDSLSVYFRELRSSGRFAPRGFGADGERSLPGGLRDMHKHALLACHSELNAGDRQQFRYAIVWRIDGPRRNDWDWQLDQDELRRKQLKNEWRSHYCTVWKTGCEITSYLFKNMERLERESRRFSDDLLDSTVPDEFLDAAAACLAVLKTPTCQRLEDGSFYGWEGCSRTAGVCEGSCSHVWNYALALPYLFPKLERSMRDLEYRYNLDDAGALSLRLMLPLGRASRFRACADGQFGTIFKVCREWLLSGDGEWLKSIWPGVKKSLEFTWSDRNPGLWDPQRTGVLTGRQHHTLDMELFGPNSWLGGFYLLALDAAARMADQVGDPAFAEECRAIYERGRKTLNTDLFNGDYFVQKVDLNDHSLLEPFRESPGFQNGETDAGVYDLYWDGDNGELKYQIGEGCLLDQMLASVHASLAGFGPIFEPEKARTALRSMMRYNFKERIGELFNPCRVFALGEESGSVICHWPDSVYKPWVPLTYAEETMTGFEYAFAIQLINAGMISDARRVVRAVRDRYDGAKRNPWNEMECGNNYARSMAAFGLIPACAGFVCDVPAGHMAFSPKQPGEFRSFWAMGTAWGKFETAGCETKLAVHGGNLKLRSFALPTAPPPVRIEKEGEELPFHWEDRKIHFDRTIEIKTGQEMQLRHRKGEAGMK